MRNTWFTSDLHFWHKNVIEFCRRPFATVEEMNQGLIDNWNAMVKPEDEVYVLGDFGFCGSTELKKITPALQGKKILVMGNHDWKYKTNRWIEFGFVEATNTNPSFQGLERLFTLSHFPYKGGGDHMEEERYAEYRVEDRGGYLLHGHVHTAWKIKGRQINVGVDVWDYKPVSIDQIEALISAC